jgi:hypothetical protein
MTFRPNNLLFAYFSLDYDILNTHASFSTQWVWIKWNKRVPPSVHPRKGRTRSSDERTRQYTQGV